MEDQNISTVIYSYLLAVVIYVLTATIPDKLHIPRQLLRESAGLQRAHHVLHVVQVGRHTSSNHGAVVAFSVTVNCKA